VLRPPLDTARCTTLRADVTRVTQDLPHELEDLIRRARPVAAPAANWPSDHENML